MKEKVLDLLEEVAELLAMIEDELGIVIAPSEVVRNQVNTANKIIALVEEKSNK